MLTITHKDGRCEPLININNVQFEQEVNGDYILSFTSFSVNNPGYELLIEESVLELDGHEFVVKNYVEEDGRKEVLAVHSYFELIDYPNEEIFGGTRTIDEILNFTLNGTGWSYEVHGSFQPTFLPNFGDDNALALNQTVCAAFECEVDIKPNNHLVYAKEIGEDKDEQLRLGHNIVTLRREIDTHNLVTVGRGRGANGLKVEWRSPNIALYGEKYGEVISDDRYTVAENLISKVIQNTQDAPESTIEITIAQIRKSGYQSSIGLGDKLWVIDETKDILVQLRVMKLITFPFTNKSPIVTLSNVKRTLTDELTEVNIKIDESNKQVQSMIEQVNDRITLEVEEVGKSIAAINVKADNITLSVSDLSGRLGNAESSINIQAGQIQSKVELSQFNGPTVTSLITQDPYSISQMAQKLNLQGLVTVTNLNTPGQTVIDAGNIYGSSFVVGRGTGSTLTMTAIAGSHLISSIDANGLGIKSNGSMGLRASGYYGVYVPTSPLVAQAGFRVEGGVSQFNTDVTVNAILNASTLQQGGYPVATTTWVANMNYITQSILNAALAQKESEIVAWANGKFALK